MSAYAKAIGTGAALSTRDTNHDNRTWTTSVIHAYKPALAVHAGSNAITVTANAPADTEHMRYQRSRRRGALKKAPVSGRSLCGRPTAAASLQLPARARAPRPLRRRCTARAWLPAMQTDFGSGQCTTGSVHSIAHNIGECIRKPEKQNWPDSATAHRVQRRLCPVHAGDYWVVSRLWLRMRCQ